MKKTLFLIIGVGAMFSSQAFAEPTLHSKVWEDERKARQDAMPRLPPMPAHVDKCDGNFVWRTFAQSWPIPDIAQMLLDKKGEPIECMVREKK